MKILQINSSARVEGANSTRLANTVTARLQAKHPGATVTVRGDSLRRVQRALQPQAPARLPSAPPRGLLGLPPDFPLLAG